MDSGAITVFLADDNVIVREGVKALLALEPDLDVVGTASDYDQLVAGADAAAPQVLVTDIRMPPNFQQEGIDAAQEIRKRHPGTGVVVLSQFDDPEYAVALLSDGAAYAYLPASTAYLPPEPEMLAALTAAGFRRPRKQRLTLGAAQLLLAER